MGKIMGEFVIYLIMASGLFRYNEQCIITEVLFCIVRWCPCFGDVKNGA